VAAALGACSAVKLAYNNLPELSYWWLDAYLDFDGTQTPKVRDELAQLLSLAPAERAAPGASPCCRRRRRWRRAR
jgi:dihydrodipicolinate synthase/N-acetylneuraminate lyase